MKKKKWRDDKIKVAIVLFWAIFLLIVVFRLVNIVELSYWSYKLSCKEPEKLNEYIKSGVITGIYYSETDEICITEVGMKNYQTTLNHELVHQYQARQGKLYNCSNPVGVFLDEMIAYTLE